LLTTVAYQFGNDQPVYALEVRFILIIIYICDFNSFVWFSIVFFRISIIKGSVASAGATMNWLRNNLNIIQNDTEIGDLQVYIFLVEKMSI
jgi:glycerol kinase